jgi:hypothetical protein
MARVQGQRWGRFGRLIPAWVLAVGAGWAGGVRDGQAEPIFVLREVVRANSSTRVRIELKAQGLYRPGMAPGAATADARMPKPRELDVKTRLVFNERIVPTGPDGMICPVGKDSGKGSPGGLAGGSLKVIRHVVQAASAINGEIRPLAASLRPDVALLVAEKRERGWPVIVFSPAGPLSWSELELVQTVGDPVALADLLPAEAVRVGEHWKVRDTAAKAMSGYDTLTANNLEATLESVDDDRARIRLKGRIEGLAYGGPGVIGCEGFATFDRQAARINHVDLNRVETRQPGPVEAGLDLTSTLMVARDAAEPSASLSDAALANVPLGVGPHSESLRITAPGGRATLLVDRHWHIFWEDSRMSVLKRLDGGQIIAQCNLMVAPSAGQGRHQDPGQFRDDIRRGLKNRFLRYLGAGEIDGHPDGGFRYKVGVQGREGDLGVIWYYYLLAGPEGDQLLATFTLAEDNAKAFGEHDVDVIGSVRWLPVQRPPR